MFVAEGLLLLTTIGSIYAGSVHCAFTYGYFTRRIDSVSTESWKTFKELKDTEGTASVLFVLFLYWCAPLYCDWVQICVIFFSVHGCMHNTFAVTNHLRLSVLFTKGGSHVLALLAVFAWMIFDSSVVTGFLSCINFVSVIANARIQSLRSGAVILASLLALHAAAILVGVYSPLSYITNEGNGNASFANPLLAFGQYMQFTSAPAHLTFPYNLVFGDVFTGRAIELSALEVVLPGIIVAYALRTDVDLNRQYEEVQKKGSVDPKVGLCSSIVPATVAKTDTPLFKHAMGGSVDRICGEQNAVFYAVPSVVFSLKEMIDAILSILLTATLTVYVGSLQCASIYTILTKKARSRENAQILRETEMTYSYALLLPVGTTFTILMLFFFYNYAQYVLVALEIFTF